MQSSQGEIWKNFAAIASQPKLEVKGRGYRLDISFIVTLRVAFNKTLSIKINVEIDGPHHYPMKSELRARDKLRDKILVLGDTPRLVVRVKNNECKNSIIRLQTEIFNFLESSLKNSEELEQAKRLLKMTE